MSVRRMWLLAVLVSLSGAAAIGHELLWIRALALHFGNTTQAITAVVATFMAGLALGNAFLGRVADRYARPLLLYRQLELIAAVSGCVVSMFLLLGGAQLDHLARLCAAAGRGSTALMCAVFALLMLIPTTVMGGTLPVLSRALSERSRPGRALAVLYACNAFGAVVGALLPDFVLIPRLGLVWTAVVVAAANGVVALLMRPLICAEPASTPEPATEHAVRPSREERAALLLSATTGFCALGLEVLWSRTLQAWAAAFVTSFAVLLAMYLGALAIGAWLAQRWTAVRSPLTAAAVLCVAAAGAVVSSVYAAPGWRAWSQRLWPRPEGLRRTGVAYEAVAALLHASYLEALVCLLLGAAFPFVAATLLQRGAAGTRTGQLFVVNTLGGVLGSLVTGFWWLPQWGEQTSYVVLASVLGTVAVLCAWLCAHEHGTRLAASVLAASERMFDQAKHARSARTGAQLCLALAAAVGALVAALPRSQLAAAHFQGAGEVLAVRQGATTSAAAVAHYVYGERHYLELQTPGVSMSNTRLGARRYMASLAHAGMLLGQHARRSALLICYGVGNTAQALLAHRSLQRLDVVDTSTEVLSLAPHFVASGSRSPLLDPRTQVFVDDGRHHLITHDAVYDVITAEPPPPNHAGVVNLYTREFYRLAKARLSEGGVITQWLPVFQLSQRDVRSMIAAFVAELPHTVLLYGYQQQLILVGSRAPLALADLDPDSTLTHSLHESGLIGIEELPASLLLTDAELRHEAAGVAALDDLHPSIAYPFEPVSEALLGFLHADGVPRGASLVRGSDPELLRRVTAGERALQLALRALPYLEDGRSEANELALGRLLQRALDARPEDEHLWSLLAADRDRVHLAQTALARPGATTTSRGPRYAVLQDASWLLARRAFYARDYPRALELLGELTPEPGQRALHALLTGGAQRALADSTRSAEAFRVAAAVSGDPAFQAASQQLAQHAADPPGEDGPWSLGP